MHRVAFVVLVACGATPSSPPVTPVAPAPPPDAPATIGPPVCNSAEDCHHEAEEHEADGTFDLAATSYGRACGFRDGASCFAQAIVLSMRVEPRDDKGAHEAFGKACELGIADGCAQVGTDLLTGVGVAVDLGAARTMLDKACAMGSGLACFNVAVSLRDGTYGATKDPTAAYKLFVQACQVSFAGGCTEQAIALHDGAGVAKDEKLATTLADRACAMKTRDCWFRAELYTNDKRHEAARELSDKACGAGSSTACHNLGVMFEKGLGGAKDEKRAHEAYAKACSLGVDNDCQR